MRNISYYAAMLMTDRDLLEQIEAFLKETKMSRTRFGVDAMGDGNLIAGLEAGRSPSLRNAERILRFMADYRQQKAA